MSSACVPPSVVIIIRPGTRSSPPISLPPPLVVLARDRRSSTQPHLSVVLTPDFEDVTQTLLHEGGGWCFQGLWRGTRLRRRLIATVPCGPLWSLMKTRGQPENKSLLHFNDLKVIYDITFLALTNQRFILNLRLFPCLIVIDIFNVF